MSLKFPFLNPTVVKLTLLSVDSEDLLKSCQLNSLTREICSSEDFWQTRYNQEGLIYRGPELSWFNYILAYWIAQEAKSKADFLSDYLQNINLDDYNSVLIELGFVAVNTIVRDLSILENSGIDITEIRSNNQKNILYSLQKVSKEIRCSDESKSPETYDLLYLPDPINKYYLTVSNYYNGETNRIEISFDQTYKLIYDLLSEGYNFYAIDTDKDNYNGEIGLLLNPLYQSESLVVQEKILSQFRRLTLSEQDDLMSEYISNNEWPLENFINDVKNLSS